MLISRPCAWSMQIFLPPKEAQGKVGQSQGRAPTNNFAFSRYARKLILGSIGTPLDHLSVKRAPNVWESKRWSILCRQGRVQSQLFWNFTALARTWSNYNIVTYKFQYSWRIWTLLVQGRESYLTQWARVVEWSPREKSHWISTGE